MFALFGVNSPFFGSPLSNFGHIPPFLELIPLSSGSSPCSFGDISLILGCIPPLPIFFGYISPFLWLPSPFPAFPTYGRIPNLRVHPPSPPPPHFGCTLPCFDRSFPSLRASLPPFQLHPPFPQAHPSNLRSISPFIFLGRGRAFSPFLCVHPLVFIFLPHSSLTSSPPPTPHLLVDPNPTIPGGR